MHGEYERAEFGDRRLNARLQTITEALEAKPSAGFPNAMTEAELEAFYRFLSNDRIDADRILAPHIEATLGRRAGRDTVLCLQDTTVFKFGTPREELGEYAGQTLFGHIAMAAGLVGFAVRKFHTVQMAGRMNKTDGCRPSHKPKGSLNTVLRSSMSWMARPTTTPS